MKCVTCNTCGWVHFEVTLDQATKSIKEFNDYFDSLGVQQQYDYYGGRKSDMTCYDRCERCNSSYKEFRDSKEDDYPPGCTVGPILKREE
jgi:protein-arginine kinase activator protein McsA